MEPYSCLHFKWSGWSNLVFHSMTCCKTGHCLRAPKYFTIISLIFFNSIQCMLWVWQVMLVRPARSRRTFHRINPWPSLPPMKPAASSIASLCAHCGMHPVRAATETSTLRAAVGNSRVSCSVHSHGFAQLNWKRNKSIHVQIPLSMFTQKRCSFQRMVSQRRNTTRATSRKLSGYHIKACAIFFDVVRLKIENPIQQCSF